MKNVITLIALLILSGCSNKKPARIGETTWQIKMNNDFKDASKSPLKAKDLKTFEGLAFFPFDTTYLVKASFEKLKHSKWFDMKTSTNRFSKERIYGIVSFTLKGKPFQLNVYQGQENLKSVAYQNYLFLPFIDNTNGKTTYTGGRYIDLTIPKGNTIEIDFNKAYNPFCAYNEKYSCPLVPLENYINLDVKAGVKTFKD